MDYKYKIFIPYRICLLGSHIDHQLGNTIGCVINKGITLYYNPYNKIEVYSEHFDSTFKCYYFDNLTYNLQNLNWEKYLLATIYVLKKYFKITTYIMGYIKSDLNIGGLSSSSAIILSYIKALCYVNNIKIVNNNLLLLAYEIEHNVLNINIGKMDQINQIFYKINYFTYYDCYNELIKYIKNTNNLSFLIIFCGKERELIHTNYNNKVNECKELAKLISNNKYDKLRYINKNNFYQKIIKNENIYKKGIHFYKEMEYVEMGFNNINDLDLLGDLINLSCLNSIENYQNGSQELIDLYYICKNIFGVYGCKFCGAGFNGNLFAIINEHYKNDIIEQITKEYLGKYPEYKNLFSMNECKMYNTGE